MGFALFGYESYQQKVAATRELSAQAAIIAENSTAALSFGDEKSAAQMLSALGEDSQIIEAVIYDGSGAPFARFISRSSRASAAAPQPRQPGVYFENGALLIFQAINLRGESIGTIFIESTLDYVYTRLREYVAMVCLVILMSLCLALGLSSRMQKRITGPIGELSEVARRISIEKNYSVRACKRANDEIGFLIDSFNEMLSQIESREHARQAAEKSLRESEERYALAARGANDGLWDWKLEGNLVYFSSRWSQMLGYLESEIGSRPDEWFGRIHPGDRDRVNAQFEAHCSGITPEFISEYRIQRKDGTFIWMLSRGIAIRDASGKAIRMAGSQTDITEGKVGDPLTGLPNRLYLIDKLESSFDAADHHHSTFALLFLDLDRFKLVNDTMGHAAGDELLVEVAGRLRSAVRSGDSPLARAGWSSTVARLGGDEFAVLLNNIRTQDDAIATAQHILKQLIVPVQLNGRQVFASASIGIALSCSANTPEDLLRNADTAMYHAKTTGKARVEVFDEQMRERTAARVEVESGLRRAIEAGELILHYQAQISTATRHVTGYEALVRWNHSERGIVGPGEFIPIAEESNLILQIGGWVLREACRQMVDWQRLQPGLPPLTISVNVSTKEFCDAGFVEAVQTVVRETGLDPSLLKLEMTESCIMGSPGSALETLRRLKTLGIGLEIDDFGTGYSSLSYLQRLPFDTVKIDRSFVKDLATDTESSEIVRTILELARSLGMTAVAEGVENNDQVERLADLGCEYLQGFYYSKPVPPSEAIALWQQFSQPDVRMYRNFRGLQALAAASSPVPDSGHIVESSSPDGASGEMGRRTSPDCNGNSISRSVNEGNTCLAQPIPED
jgi:diguanylate cyclase (GGDEF)-like protein/PAS domain S-box-containing protein